MAFAIPDGNVFFVVGADGAAQQPGAVLHVADRHRRRNFRGLRQSSPEVLAHSHQPGLRSAQGR